MNPTDPIKFRLRSRRQFLWETAGGFFGTVMTAMGVGGKGAVESAHIPMHRGPAKAVIYLFMCGGVSHIDTFDPKDNRWAGTLIDAVGFGDNLAEMKRPVIPCRRTFTRHGQSGIPVSEWFPHVGGIVDEMALIRSMWCHETNHFPAVIETSTGHRNRFLEHPCLGSWVTHALGRSTENLPAFVNLGRPTSPVQVSGGFLGSSVSATPLMAGDEPIRNLRPPAGISAADRDRHMDLLEKLNREFREQYAMESSIRGR
ncbi:MAG: DUF1501 domain-containing protein, partial [Verrucomicrobiales bacterium]|nr:DUF1501 domain-containing protein [Verrucomicrobiales bacterium]